MPIGSRKLFQFHGQRSTTESSGIQTQGTIERECDMGTDVMERLRALDGVPTNEIPLANLADVLASLLGTNKDAPVIPVARFGSAI